MQKITPFLWFTDNAEEAANFYVSVFKNSKIVDILRTPVDGATPAGTPLVVTFELEGQTYNAINGGAVQIPTEAVSFAVECADQAEVDYYWEKLSADPEKEVCGWLKDKYGYSWQIVPARMMELFADPDKEKAGRALHAMMDMKKIDLAAVEAAYNGN